MEVESPRPKGREGAILALNAAIKAFNLAENISSITPVKTISDKKGNPGVGKIHSVTSKIK